MKNKTQLKLPRKPQKNKNSEHTPCSLFKRKTTKERNSNFRRAVVYFTKD